ncbi:metal ABC transporter solute-binding protein, Zn/Mn family [Pontibacter chinhatensis]|uniref:Manganese/zinc/iron transport system substrate-binding protein n=1 Tax=Pontibacter chinhatensis TaxID=1436961 RepID=A0A1I2N114_9BACT|nr:zinc ABC transporter substrate-binding protein [Pontibacter chinhatensis]SFF97452.1 manganese/zinc/iron transport system substrate-binding protein [Pontibacter chinhatensis]
MKTLYSLAILLFTLLASACTQTDNRGTMAEGQRMKVLTTTSILKDAVANIAGDAAEVESVMGSGVDPHLYKATQGDLQKMMDADMIVYNGLYLEGKMGEVLEKLSRQKTVVTATASIPKDKLRASAQYANSNDPHVWFDVQLWQEVVKHVSQQMQEKDPANAEVYKQNTQAYLQELDELNQWVAQQIQTIPEQQRILITAHDAFGYFGDAYSIKVRGLQGISTVSEFGLLDVSSLVKYIVENKIKAVFVESSVSPKAIEAVVVGCRERGHEVEIGGTLYSDALGEDGTPEGTYTGMVRHNVTTIVSALR